MNISSYINKYISFVDSLSEKFDYDQNIKHVLYIIVPVFIIKYGLNNENMILDMFSSTPIIKSNSLNESNVFGFFDRKLLFDVDYYTKKYIVIKNDNYASYIELFDTLIHEYNHSLNSMKNEIFLKDNNIYLRTGLCSLIYDKNDLNIPIKKTDELLLEEVINTRQVESLIDIVINIDRYNIDNIEILGISNTLKRELEEKKYLSSAYSVHMYICNDLINNKTFFSTLEKTRLNGELDFINDWFDDITGIKGSYLELNNLLTLIFEFEEKLSSNKLKNKIYIYKIKKYNNRLKEIINCFLNNSFV